MQYEKEGEKKKEAAGKIIEMESKIEQILYDNSRLGLMLMRVKSKEEKESQLKLLQDQYDSHIKKAKEDELLYIYIYI